jgi:predicted PurR-regulated permease PerM
VSCSLMFARAASSEGTMAVPKELFSWVLRRNSGHLSSEPSSNEGADSEEQRALGWTALAAVGAVLWLVRPVGMGLFLGMLMGFAFEPLYRRIVTRCRPPIAAVATVGTSLILVVVAVGGLVWILVRDGTAFERELVTSLGSGGSARAIVASIGRVTSRVGITAEELTTRLRALAEGVVARAAGLAEGAAAATADMLLAWFFAALTMYAILTHQEEITTTVERALPLRPDYTRKLGSELRNVGRQTLVGAVGSGVMQGLLATVGYWIAGLPRPIFFGAASAILSLVPGLGTMLVWVPAGVVLVVLGHVGRGIFLLAWGVLVVTSLNDYVLRPRFVGRQAGLPPLAMFVALFGGAASMGLKGLIVGPVLMSLAFAALKLYVEEARRRRSPASRGPS